MNARDLCFAPATEIARLVHEREISAREVTQAFLARIDALDRTLNCFIRVMAEDARAQAGQIDEALARGDSPGALAGVPVAIKDLVDVAGVPTTGGAHRRFHTMPATDAPLVTRLRRHGAVLIGKTNLHEVAYGATNVNPHFGPTRNPWDLTRIPGGSSGGSAAAVAAGLCAGAVGTDTGGSIRIPASLCGIVGIKPTYDRVPRGGVLPLSWSLDHLGPLTRTVGDAALLFSVMAGGQPADALSGRQSSPPPDERVTKGIAGVRVGLPRTFFWEKLQDGVEAAVDEAVHMLQDLGADILDVELPFADMAGYAVSVIVSAEATAVHERRLRAHPDAFGNDVRLRLESGFFVTATDYVQAHRARALLTREFLRVLKRVNVLVMPATALTATPIDEQYLPGSRGLVPVRLPLTKLTNPFNLTGLPAISVPCGFTAEGLPVGVQLVGRPFDEGTLFRIAGAYEHATGWTQRRPPLGLPGP